MTAQENPVYCQLPKRYMSPAEMHKELTYRHGSCTTLVCEMKLHCWEELKRQGHAPGPVRHCMKCRNNSEGEE